MTQLILPMEANPALPVPATGSGSITGQGVRFFLIGSAGTLVQLGLFASSSELLGAQVASVASWLISTLVTNAAHRALTFGVRGAERNRSDQIVAFLTCLVGLLITSVVLAELPDADGVSGIIAILVVNTVVGVARFVGMHWWLSGSGRRVAGSLARTLSAARDNLPTHRGMSGLHH